MTSSRPKNPDIRRLAFGRLIAVTGGAAAYTALMFTIWDQTHSPGLQSLALLLTFGVVGVLGSVTGHLGDRFDRKKVMVLSELGSASCYAAMALTSGSPGILIAFACASAIFEAPFLSASAAAIPNLAGDEDELSHANSLLGMGRNAGIMLGPVIGGVLLSAIGATWVFGLTAITFLLSAVITMTVRGRMRSEPGEDDDEHTGVLAGIAFLAREPVLRRITLAFFVFLLGMGMSMVADAPLADFFGAGSLGFGLLIACWGGGSLLGAALGRLLRPETELRWLVVGSYGIAAAAVGVGLAPWYPLALASLLVMGIFDGLTIVAETGIMQRRSPDAIRSRVVAGFEAVLSLGIATAYIAAGPVLARVEVQTVYLIGGVAALAAAVVLTPLLRHFRAGGPAGSEDPAGQVPPIPPIPEPGLP